MEHFIIMMHFVFLENRPIGNRVKSQEERYTKQVSTFVMIANSGVQDYGISRNQAGLTIPGSITSL